MYQNQYYVFGGLPVIRSMNLRVWPLVAVLGIAVSAVSAQAQTVDFSNIGIKNFGQVDKNYYRGAQPDSHDYASLAKLGVKTVIDLERDGDSSEAGSVKAAGMNFVRIEMSDRETPTQKEVSDFLSIVSNPANLPVFVHCHGGRHRTGAMTAVYRMKNYGWTAERAYDEMKQYHFTTTFGHTPLKHFVFDYYSNLASEKPAVPITANPTPAAAAPVPVTGSPVPAAVTQSGSKPQAADKPTKKNN